MKRLFAWASALSLLVGCNSILGNEEHGSAPAGNDSDATVITPIGVDSGVHDASLGYDVRSDVAVDAAAVQMSDSSGGTQDAEVTQEAGTVVATCTADGGACKPAADCHAGALMCADGGELCAATTQLADGTPCGTDTMHFCGGGTCSQCNAGGDCSSATTPCVVSTYDCSTGTAQCKFARNAPEGMACGSGTPAMYCNAGVCAACKVGAACSPSTNPCHVGTVSVCTGGVATCLDTNALSSDGTSCTSGSVTGGVCSAGTCTACTTNAPCNPGGNPCANGTMSCSAGPKCSLTSDVQDGTTVAACGTNEICLSGACAVKCDATSCGSGCCSGNTCLTAAQETTAMCGTGVIGAACGQCAIGVCSNGGCACPSGTLDCSGVCATCATPPTGGASACSGTTCTFVCSAAGTTKCGNACLTFQNDNNNCGSCGHVCGAGTTCSGTTCVCNTSSGCAGCCSSGAACEPFASEAAASCGAGGALCKPCGTNQSCSTTAGTCGCSGANPNTCSAGTCTNFSTDANNCGRCGHGCQGGSCAGGVCQPVVVVTAAVAGNAVDFATDGTNVIWGDASGNTINLVTSPGGAKTVLASNANGMVSSPVNVALAPTTGNVWWTQQGGEVGHTMLSAGSPQIFTQQTGNVSGLVADDSGAYFLISTGGGVTLYDLLNSNLLFVQTSATCGCSSLAAGATITSNVFSDRTDSEIIVMNESPTFTAENFPITGQVNANYITSDGTFAYWGAGSAPFYIARAPLAAPASNSAQIVVNGLGGPIAGLATDNTNLYFSSGTEVNYVSIASAVAAGGAITPTPLTTFTTGNTLVFPKYAAGAVYFFYAGGIDKIATP